MLGSDLVQTARARALDLAQWEPLRRPVALGRLLWTDIERSELFRHAAGMAYMTLFSVVPSLAMTFAIISAFQPIASAEAQWFEHFQSFVLQNLAPDAGIQVVTYLRSFLDQLDITRIGITGVVGLLVTLILLLRNIELAFNEIWLVKNPRSLFRRFLFFWTFCTLGGFLLTLAIGMLSQFGLAGGFFTTIGSALLTFAFFALLYKIGPNCQVQVHAAVAGAVAATVLFRLGSVAFSLYIARSDFYKNVYGALAAVPVFLLWLYVAWSVTLLGAILAWRVQQGFSTATEAEDQAKAQVAATPLDVERNVQLRALMPVLCVVAVNEAFVSGRRGVTGRQIAMQLDMPLNWVTEGLRASASLGYLAAAVAEHQGAITDSFDEASAVWLPLRPPQDVTLRGLVEELTQAAHDWISRHRPAARGLEPRRLVNALVRRLGQGEEALTLDRFLMELRAGT